MERVDLQNPFSVLPWILVIGGISYFLFSSFGLLRTWWVLLFTSLLLFPAMEDLETGYISDGWSGALAVGGLAAQWSLGGDISLWGMVMAVGLVGGLFLCCQGAVGEGDIWLAGGIGCWLNGWDALLFLWLAFVLGGLMGMYRLCRGGALSEEMAFAPFLCAAGGVTYGAGDALWAWYVQFV